MSDAAIDPRLPKLVRQHAQTSALLGVDFVPAYRTGPSGDGPPPSAGAPDQPSLLPEIETKPGTAWDPSLGPVAHDGRERARVQAALNAIRVRYEADAPHKQFVTAHHNIVFGEGDPCAKLMFIGEAPGADEDRTGRPFVGRAGQLLDKMILAMGLRRCEVYIANVLKTRPPNNATPTITEAQLCAPYLYDQIAAIRPLAIVTLGLPASRLILASDQSMGSLRGRWAEWRHPDQLAHADVAVPVMPTFHPAFLLRAYTPENRTKVWADLKMVMDRLGVHPARA